jgi:hypothetical protein
MRVHGGDRLARDGGACAISSSVTPGATAIGANGSGASSVTASQPNTRQFRAAMAIAMIFGT